MWSVQWGVVSIEGANETGSVVCGCGNTGIAVEDVIYIHFPDIEHIIKR